MGSIFWLLESQSALADIIINFLYDTIPKGLTDKNMRQKINKILEQEEGIAMASEVLIHISKDEIEQARLESELKYELDTQSNLVYAKREGIKEGMRKGINDGMQKGEKKGQMEIIDLLKSGKSPEEIIREYGN